MQEGLLAEASSTWLRDALQQQQPHLASPPPPATPQASSSAAPLPPSARSLSCPSGRPLLAKFPQHEHLDLKRVVEVLGGDSSDSQALEVGAASRAFSSLPPPPSPSMPAAPTVSAGVRAGNDLPLPLPVAASLSIQGALDLVAQLSANLGKGAGPREGPPGGRLQLMALSAQLDPWPCASLA